MKALRVLVVEDNDALAANLFEYLEPRGHQLDRAADGLTALHLASTQSFDVLVLDWMMPGLSGIEVCQKLRAAGQPAPILMLTARDTVNDKLQGFEAGADDYLVKPFDLRELEARIRVLATRGKRDSLLRVGDLSFDPGTLVARRGARSLELTRIEEKMLEALMRAHPKVLRREELEHLIWGSEAPDSDALRSHVYRLRSQIDRGETHAMLETVPRYGYRLRVPGEA